MKKLTTEEFIQKARLIHGDKYDYSQTVYINSRSKVNIICPKHGVFLQMPTHHLNGSGCSNCCNNLKPTKEQFIQKAKAIYGDKYDYSLAEYENSYTKIKIICPKHGIFLQRPRDHLQHNGCPSCAKVYKPTKEQFIEKARIIHGDKYDYSMAEYKNANAKIKIICSKHGIFLQRANHHLHGMGCPYCKSSKGELFIKNWLDLHNINFETQKKFNDCRLNRTLPFDFYLPTYNTCIEYDGEQHYKAISIFGGEDGLKSCQKRDKIKTEYCQNNNINLIRIRYDENIENKLKELLLDKNL